MIIKSIEIDKFRAFQNVEFFLGKRITAISGRNATQKTTVLGMLGQPFTISQIENPLYGCKTIDGYNFKSQFKEKFKISPAHDVIGEHRWTLRLHNKSFSDRDYFTIESIARNQKGGEATLRFWNAESRAKGAGYIQAPVYFLSLSRLFPIGESGKTQTYENELTEDELKYCINNYRTILSIQDMHGNAEVGIEKATASRTFAGINDNVHDIFTNSAGEGNIVRIILAILSFKRLKENYGKNYKGGILLIDELDATLYGFSQKKLVDYLYLSAKEFSLQIVFTTHSPIILRQVNKYQRWERKRLGISLPISAYDSAIVYLEPEYSEEGMRMIKPRNISTANELNEILNDINLTVIRTENRINVYCEDEHAVSFVKYLLSKEMGINTELYMRFIDIDLGWTNYVQLYEKEIPEFRNNIILLDADVPQMKEYRNKKRTIESAVNISFLPVEVEKGLFALLKDHGNFNEFQNSYSVVRALNYDICFNEWALGSDDYKSEDFKHWFDHIENILGDRNILFKFWMDKNEEKVDIFLNDFITVFNTLAERMEADALPAHVAEE
ncbi:MAG: ATP-binding protein [Lachnospiraceae bacterium]|nr:ATP-binding protein [Lachnospiraceae bacterium]